MHAVKRNIALFVVSTSSAPPFNAPTSNHFKNELSCRRDVCSPRLFWFYISANLFRWNNLIYNFSIPIVLSSPSKANVCRGILKCSYVGKELSYVDRYGLFPNFDTHVWQQLLKLNLINIWCMGNKLMKHLDNGGCCCSIVWNCMYQFSILQKRIEIFSITLSWCRIFFSAWCLPNS